MTHRLKNIEHSCSIIDKTIAMAATIRQYSEDKDVINLAWDIDSNLEDIRHINDQLRTLAKEYIAMIEELGSEVNGLRDECNALDRDIEDMEEEINELRTLLVVQQ